jgi:hypothetical protein
MGQLVQQELQIAVLEALEVQEELEELLKEQEAVEALVVREAQQDLEEMQ